MKTKVLKPVTDKAKEKLNKDADKVIKQLEASGLKQDFIAAQTGKRPATVSRFMNKKPGYITQSMVDAMKEFIESRAEVK